jgi:pyruvate/2-oxoglutarate dehydrogenase complex dihydrolipoamide acyltransferase (E2) component
VPARAADAKDGGAADASRFTSVVEVRMPDMRVGDGAKGGGGRILRWYKGEGDAVRYQDLLCDVETSDFTFGMQCEDEYDQVVGRILVEAPSGPVPAGEVICTLLHEAKEKKKAGDAKETAGDADTNTAAATTS